MLRLFMWTMLVDNVKHCIDLVIVTIKRFTVVMIVTIV